MCAISALNTPLKYCLRPGQLEAILPVLHVHGQDTFICLPTGGGREVSVHVSCPSLP